MANITYISGNTHSKQENKIIMNETEQTADMTRQAAEMAAEQPVSAPEIEAQVELENDTQCNYNLMNREQLMAELAKILQADALDRHKEVNTIKHVYYAIRKNELEAECAAFIEGGGDPAQFSSKPDEDEPKFKDMLNEFKEKRAAYLAAEEERKAENLAIKIRIMDQLQTLVEDMDNIGVNTARFRQLEQEFKNITDIPASAVADTWKRYNLIVDQFYDCRKVSNELRELDFKKNLEAKTILIEKAEALKDEEDVIAAFRTLQGLHDEWRNIGPVARDLREDMWNRFKEASTVVNKRHADFFEARKAEEQANEDAKTALCEEIETIKLDEITNFAAWEEATKRIIDMQNRWKQLGFASKKNNNALFARFRKACDDFFTAKSENYKRVKEDLAKNLEKKLELCRQAEELKETETDMRLGTEKALELQAKWKAIGGVPRKYSEEIWQRFMGACNHFFEARREASREARREEKANLEAKRELIKTLNEVADGTPKDQVQALIRECQTKWQQTGHVPFKMKDALYQQFRGAIDKLYEKFDLREVRARMQAFEAKAETLASDKSQLGRERDKLMRALEARKNDLKTYENNLGFFNIKSNAGNSMLNEMQRKMNRLKDDIADIQKKIALLDSKTEK